MSTVIVSDIHLGSRNSQTALLCRMLETNFDRLILNGDTVDTLNLKKMKSKHWHVIGKLREVARERELILIRGNHEGCCQEESNGFGQLDVLAAILGVPLHDEYDLKIGDRRYLVLHGDLFDPTLHWPILTDGADWCYRAMLKINKKAGKWLKRRDKKLGGVIEFVKQRSVIHAKRNGYQGVITGHTHFPDDVWLNDVHYLNTGCWVDRPCTYIRGTQTGVHLCTFDEGESTAPPRPITKPGRIYAESIGSWEFN